MSRIFILAGTPGALPVGEKADIPTVEWASICHLDKRNAILVIDHQPHRDTSRWTHVDRKRPFVVSMRNRLSMKLGSSSTLAGAIKIARREADRGKYQPMRMNPHTGAWE